MKFMIDIKDFAAWRKYLEQENYINKSDTDEELVAHTLDLMEIGKVTVTKLED